MPLDKKNNRENIADEVKKSLAGYFNISPANIKLDARLIEDLGLDSFGLVELRFELKKAFGTEIKKEDIQNIQTVQDVIDFISSGISNNDS